MAEFILDDVLSERPKMEVGFQRQRIVYRSPEDLLPDKENFYNIEDIADLKESIRSLGLLQALLIEKRDDKDYIIAGHRRQKCCLELLNEGDERFRKIPCVYTVSTNMDVKDDETTRQIKLIQANSYRKKTGWEEMTEALKMVDLVQELRKKTEMEGKSRDIAAGLLGTSSTQIGRYKSIRTNLSDDFMGAFKENNISLSVAEELSRLKPEYQRQAWEHYTERGSITLPEVKAFRDLQEEHRDIPGQLTLEEVTRQQKPPENETAIAPELQIERFYDALNRTDKERVKKCDRMVPQLLFIRYSIVRIRNGFFNYQGNKEGITFNPGSRLEHFLNWNDFAKELISRFGKKKPVKMASVVEEEPENNMPGPAKCITGQSGSGQCGAAAYCDKGYNCCAQCPDDCNGRCGWIESCQPAAELQDEKQHDFVELTEIEEHIVEDNKTSDHTGDLAEILPENWPEYLRDIPMPTETALASYLYDQERDLRQILNIEKEEPGLPHMTIMQQQMVVAGLRLLQNHIKSMEEPEQPPLPKMRNNDQRKKWLKNHKAWGLWYTDPHTGARYYKYDFENGARLIAEEYAPEPKNENSWWVPTESCYLHLVGGPEPERAGGVPKWTYHPKYNKFPNSETELIEFLKEIQK